ncbi:sodium:solute symporter family protein [Paramaledivibacter caminithermalis]|uniref:Solute:Na+ symporter, SSS family n=1 Tax=Paramaledivibacter caminithermalis (strain DSM 15212 / CIP 107654 / DViRD3) TaxID=1121301 RepID=A0A1M6LJX7_PARC5|nr:sodium:solute symporter family protein [Paramaledivibacter caminithermalis]SHJ71506.1 solute:Na+ symporter, SSS family [Paramaledivibacter caminithermalis DSM 15212]
MNKSLVYLIYFTFYTFVLLWVGKGGFKRTRDIRDFYVAGNSLGLRASIFTFVATWFSAASMQGLTGTLYAYGYSVILYSVVGWFLGAVFLVFMSVKLKDYDILTVPEYFRIRYDSRLLQVLGGLVIVISYILYVIIQIRGFGIVMSELLDINYTLSIFLVYLFVIYTTFGGLFSVARTDGLNFILLFMGTMIAASIILKNIGGLTLMNEKVALIATKPFIDFPYVIEKGGLLDPFCNGLQRPIMVFTICLAWGLGLAANPQYAIRISSAKDKKTAIKMICLSVLILAVIYVGIIIIGIGSRVLEPALKSVKSVDEVFPYIINNVIYSPLSGFILISIAAAAISSANSQLLILASGFSYDIYKNLFKQDISEEKLLNVNRLFIFLAGTISLILSINPPNSLLIYGSYVWAIFSATFLLPLYGGLYWKKATKEGALASFIGGLVIIILFFIINTFLDSWTIALHPVLPAVVAALILFYVISRITYQKKGD